MSDFGIKMVKDKIENIKEFLEELEKEIDKFETLIEINDFEGCRNLDDAIGNKISRVKTEVLLNEIGFEKQDAKNFIQLMNKNEKHHDHYRANEAENRKNKLEKEMTEKMGEIKKELEEISQLKNSFINVFGIFVGILGYIFINFNVFNNIGKLSLTHILVVVTLLNISFIGGIIVLVVLLKSLIVKEKIRTKPLIIILSMYSIVALLIILLVHLYGTTVYLIN